VVKNVFLSKTLFPRGVLTNLRLIFLEPVFIRLQTITTTTRTTIIATLPSSHFLVLLFLLFLFFSILCFFSLRFYPLASSATPLESDVIHLITSTLHITFTYHSLSTSDLKIHAKHIMSSTSMPAVDMPMTTGWRFQPPFATDTPLFLFKTRLNPAGTAPRFVHHNDSSKFLIFTDGACPRNGYPDARAGGGFVYRPANKPKEVGLFLSTALHTQGGYYFRLPNRGPRGTLEPQTSNRAELTAVLQALQCRCWVNEGFRHLVIATDSTYVVDGSSKWLHTWLCNGWTTASGEAVKNRDLWEELVAVLTSLAMEDLIVSFWYIPSELNGEADRVARLGAAMPELEFYSQISENLRPLSQFASSYARRCKCMLMLPRPEDSGSWTTLA
jgi:ribonuclease HI